MTGSIITITEDNLGRLIRDERVYVIRKYRVMDGYTIGKIRDCTVSDLLSNDVIAIRFD